MHPHGSASGDSQLQWSLHSGCINQAGARKTTMSIDPDGTGTIRLAERQYRYCFAVEEIHSQSTLLKGANGSAHGLTYWLAMSRRSRLNGDP